MMIWNSCDVTRHDQDASCVDNSVMCHVLTCDVTCDVTWSERRPQVLQEVLPPQASSLPPLQGVRAVCATHGEQQQQGDQPTAAAGL
jgi:hypothetical protein